MSHDEHLLTIAEVADRAGLKLSRVRYYERAGLLPRPERGAGRERRYRTAAVAWLAVITEAQEAGLTLAEIAELLDLRGLVLGAPARERR
ncbi:MAG TPA: MerR family transcriptional regulator [Baekduia sp.]|uniref:MerR family transcriptional regulator n=1 Tax=Baekduia sp. TaxID=2600305 RepID=UPI002B51DDC7|nr:MerR family transcriptional regulator [Baekduia sp.]HMJ35141.1 MerR family transcriptional regulator [Baekduia sp.]